MQVRCKSEVAPHLYHLSVCATCASTPTGGSTKTHPRWGETAGVGGEQNQQITVLLRSACSMIIAPMLYYPCSTHAAPVQYQCNTRAVQHQRITIAATEQYQCPTSASPSASPSAAPSAEPVQYQCRISAVPVQYHCSTTAVKVQYPCSPSAVLAQHQWNTSAFPAQ